MANKNEAKLIVQKSSFFGGAAGTEGYVLGYQWVSLLWPLVQYGLIEIIRLNLRLRLLRVLLHDIKEYFPSEL